MCHNLSVESWSATGFVSATLLVDDHICMNSLHSHLNLRPDLCSVTRYRDLAWQLSCTEGICGQKKRNGKVVEAGARICLWSQPWIYVSVTEPFMRRLLPLLFRGELLVCRWTCCANISCPGAPAAIVASSPSCHPVSVHSSFVRHTMEDRDTIEGHFCSCLAQGLCLDTG